MSARLINLNPDLQRLVNEGYEVEVREAHLIIHSVPYVNAQRQVARGLLVSPLLMAGDKTLPPTDHRAWFVGEHPCHMDGSALREIQHMSGHFPLIAGIASDHIFSAKPAGGYSDYYHKMSQYVRIIAAPARALDESAVATTFAPVLSLADDSVFHYADTATARAGIGAITPKLAMGKVAIVGLGGTGSYILDLVAKTPVQEIHLFDGDLFLQHNAFRSPGAPSIEELKSKLSKVEYFSGIYGRMRKGIVPHPTFVSDGNVRLLADFNFVFVCVDNGPVRKVISDALHANGVPFIDVGMDVQQTDDLSLYGQCRTTLSTPAKNDHYTARASFNDAGADGVYGSNIQIADLNALNAAMAVIKWKKFFCFYQDLMQEHDSVYAINAHQLTRDDRP